MLTQLLPAFRATLLLTAVTGFVYPGIVTGLCELLFKDQAHGSLVMNGSQVVGSKLIAQNFTKPQYFWPRPSSANFDGAASTGSNLGPSSQKLVDRVKAAADQFRKDNPEFSGPIPADALTTSASGLDPHISPAYAEAQAARVAKARGMDRAAVLSLVASQTEGRPLGFLGEPRVNVFELNRILDQRK